ncbi:DUF4905 domain-containing protein [Mucilaginibacter sp. McL0603]|uniref:DUF4905 domain-containing protein n=1 Tax=Mucilaginibacter sp. McL0603 TaxID=3415670 RepID=UPI003CE6D88D
MLQPQIRCQFKSTVWRLEIDALSQIIFAEVRDQADKKVYFAAISLDTGELLFDNLQTEERWLTGIETAYNGVLLLHNYQSEAAPVHKGLTAIDGGTGKVLWNNFTHAFDHLSVNGPIIYDTRIQPRKLFLVNIITGEIIRPYNSSMDTEMDNEITLPEEISIGSLKHISLSTEPFGNTIHYLEHNNFRIVSLHTFTEGTLQQRLYIISNAEIVYEDLLNSDIQKLQPEAFLLHKDQLIYLKDRSQLKVLNL